jgi:hypothetical protein
VLVCDEASAIAVLDDERVHGREAATEAAVIADGADPCDHRRGRHRAIVSLAHLVAGTYKIARNSTRKLVVWRFG